MLSQGQAGLQTVADGNQGALRIGKSGEQIVGELHGRYYETTYRRAMFGAANQTGIATTIGLATTYTGLILSNPLGSAVNLVVCKVSASFPVAVAAAVTVGVMVGFNAGTNVTHTAASTTLRSNFLGGAQPVGLVDTSATMPTAPTLQKVIGTIGTAAITSFGTVPSLSEDFEGSIILPPGAYAAIFTSAVSGAVGFLGSISWEEVPV